MNFLGNFLNFKKYEPKPEDKVILRFKKTWFSDQIYDLEYQVENTKSWKTIYECHFYDDMGDYLYEGNINIDYKSDSQMNIELNEYKKQFRTYGDILRYENKSLENKSRYIKFMKRYNSKKDIFN